MLNKNKNILIEMVHDFDSSGQKVINQGLEYYIEDFDKLREDTIEDLIKLLSDFFSYKIDLITFKKKIDGTNKRNNLWGFRGINGMMFFNQLYKCSSNKQELRDTLVNVIKIPLDIDEAKEKINILYDYVKEICNNVQDKRKAPRPKSILFFLSYFWQVQAPNKFPTFFISLESSLSEIKLLESKEVLSEYYEDFYSLNEEIRRLFEKELKKHVNLWYIEHVIWRYYRLKQEAETPKTIKKEFSKEKIKLESYLDYAPPVISNIIQLSRNESSPQDFEKVTGKLFIMLGFDVEILGQGKGRTVDIIARGYGYGMAKPYVILIDCKGRGKEDYRINAGDERTIIEYIKSFLYDNPKDRASDLYFLIVSSGFNDIPDSIFRKIKLETNVEISLIKVDTLLFLLSLKLQKWDFDIERIKAVFQKSGIISKEDIQEILVGR